MYSVWDNEDFLLLVGRYESVEEAKKVADSMGKFCSVYNDVTKKLVYDNHKEGSWAEKEKKDLERLRNNLKSNKKN